MPQEHEQDDKDQDHAADENVRDGLHCCMNQSRAIIKRFDLDAGRQLPAFEVLNLFSNLLKDIERLGTTLQQYDTFDNVVALIDADLSQSYPGPDRDLPKIFDKDRCPFFRRHHDIFNICDLVDET